MARVLDIRAICTLYGVYMHSYHAERCMTAPKEPQVEACNCVALRQTAQHDAGCSAVARLVEDVDPDECFSESAKSRRHVPRIASETAYTIAGIYAYRKDDIGG
jgi:hypothetical protein